MEDSRTRRKKVTHATLPLERTYCVNCGKPKGWVSVETSKFIAAQQIIVICDECEEKYGAPDLQKVEVKEF